MDRLARDVRGLVLRLVQTPRDRRQLLVAGLGDADVRRLVRRRHLHHFHGHYIDGRVDAETARIACAQARHPGSAVSHFSAAHLAGMPTWTDSRRPAVPPADAVWLTRPPASARNQRRPDIVVRRARLEPVDRTRHLWLPVTSAARTVVDLARALPFREGIVTVDHALRSGVPPAELDGVLDRQFGWPGIARARKTVAFGDPRAESVFESIARAAFAEAGLPPPILQVQFWDGCAWILDRVDFWWPQFRTVGEADGLAKYDSDDPEERRRLLRRHYQRDQRLSDRAVELVHFGWEDLLDPRSKLPSRFQAAFARGLARPGDAPTWRARDRHNPALWLPAA
jgi:hypothetical protein